MAEWVDVNKSLPEMRERVLINYTYEGGYHKTICAMYIGGKYGWVIEDEYEGMCEITHWMPLPKPPIPSLKFCSKCGFVAVYDEYQQDGVRVRCTHCGHKTEFYSNKIEASNDWNSQ